MLLLMLDQSIRKIFLTKQSQFVELFLGRMQPVHKGHQAIIKGMKNPIVALVKGAKSSQDKSKNPLDANYQVKLLKKLNPNLKVIIVPTGYIPDIINEIRKEGFEVSKIYAGSDRFKGYQGQISGYNKRVEEDQQIDVTYQETPRVTSASDVRNSIKSDDFALFKTLMPKQLHTEWDNLKKLIQ